jgi:hypothetical protein
MTITAPATEFARNFAKIKDQATANGMVEITSHGRVVGAYISAQELEEFRRFKAADRRVVHVSEFDDEMLRALEAAKFT